NNDTEWRGKWKEHFKNNQAIVLEIGCGKGDVAYGLAKNYPDKNYIGVDIKAVRMYSGAKRALEDKLPNLAFLRCDIHGLRFFFAENEVDEIWITFPDPFPKKGQTRNRLTQEVFLVQYAKMLPPGSHIFFKTDNTSLFSFTLDHFEVLNEKGILKIDVLEMTRDLHGSDLLNADNSITTDYERRFLKMDKPICYLSFTIAPGPNIEDAPVVEKVALITDEKAPRIH
ncbi:MAG TPA: tRNA (guanosine(46)-N7)-methyltransferase TrmB, partial [Bacteroidetes bacterium]|nr:tRNA (guanosine(46)-N7)-methyltransferase TrmB [Bacteroidota bacterium]